MLLLLLFMIVKKHSSRKEKRKTQASDAYVFFIRIRCMHMLTHEQRISSRCQRYDVCLFVAGFMLLQQFHKLTQGREEFGASPSGWSTEQLLTHRLLRTDINPLSYRSKTVLSTLVMYLICSTSNNCVSQSVYAKLIFLIENHFQRERGMVLGIPNE